MNSTYSMMADSGGLVGSMLFQITAILLVALVVQRCSDDFRRLGMACCFGR